MRLPFRIVNVFTVDGDPFSGNPLCVFEDARGLTDDQMQALARQTNLSETTFVLPASRGGTARVRIFTPGYEMPFAGHPTLGTASVLGGQRVVLELPAGNVEVNSVGRRWTLRAAKPPSVRSAEFDPATLGLPRDAIAGEPLWVNTGVEQLVVPVTSAEHVRAARPRGPLEMAYVWAPDGTVRFFFEQHGAYIEDPATGSAAANLGGYLQHHGRTPIELTLRQGDAVHRPSRLHLRVDDGIHVGGDVVELGTGAFEL